MPEEGTEKRLWIRAIGLEVGEVHDGLPRRSVILHGQVRLPVQDQKRIVAIMPVVIGKEIHEIIIVSNSKFVQDHVVVIVPLYLVKCWVPPFVLKRNAAGGATGGHRHALVIYFLHIPDVFVREVFLGIINLIGQLGALGLSPPPYVFSEDTRVLPERVFVFKEDVAGLIQNAKKFFARKKPERFFLSHPDYSTCWAFLPIVSLKKKLLNAE